MDTTEIPENTNPEVIEIKKSLLRKVLIVTGATAGLIIAGALLTRAQPDSEVGDLEVIETDGEVLVTEKS